MQRCGGRAVKAMDSTPCEFKPHCNRLLGTSSIRFLKRHQLLAKKNIVRKPTNTKEAILESM